MKTALHSFCIVVSGIVVNLWLQSSTGFACVLPGQQLLEGQDMAQRQRSSPAGENATEQQKDDFAFHMRERLNKASVDIEQLRRRAVSLSGNARVSMEKWITELEKENEALNRRLQHIGETGNKAWHSIQEDLEQALDDLEKEIQNNETLKPGDNPGKLRYEEKESAGPQGSLPH